MPGFRGRGGGAALASDAAVFVISVLVLFAHSPCNGIRLPIPLRSDADEDDELMVVPCAEPVVSAD